MPIPAPLQRALDELLSGVPRWMSRLAHETRGQLQSPTTTRSLRGTAGAPLFDAEVAVHQHHPLWARRVAELLEQRWRADFEAPLAPTATRRATPRSLDSLSLVDEDQADENVELLRIVQAVESSHDAVLRELQARAATLAGHDRVRAESNPLRPDLLARVVWDAAGVLGLAGPARLALLRALAQPLIDALGRLATDALARLEAQGVQPAAWRAHTSRDRRVPTPVSSGFDVTRPGALDALRVRMRPQLGTPTTGSGSLEALDADVLRMLGAAAPGAGDAALVNRVRERLPLLEALARDIADRQVMELMAGLVEALIGDAALRMPVRAALARLQVPLLRLALREPALLNDYTHPAWRLLERLGSHTLGFDDDADPRLGALMQGVDAVCAELAGGRRADAAAFAHALEQFEALARADLDAERLDARELIERLERTERRSALRVGLRRMAQAHVHHAQAEPLGRGQLTAARVDAQLAAFLTGPWVDAMVEIALRDGEDSPAARAAVALVDDVLDSLRPIRGSGERERLIARVPAIVQRIEQGCALIGLPAGERQAVLDLLMNRHRELLRGDLLRGELPMAAPPGLEPQEIVRRLRAEDEAQAGPSAVGGDTAFDVGSLPTVPAALLDEVALGAAPGDWLRRLEPGTWLRLVARGCWTAARLLWVGPAREMWLFSDAREGQTHALTRSALERLVALQLAAPLEERSLLERAVDRLLAQAR
ncbi:DUF1631 family protein [Caldimonas sp. KR1-144]|uniref:DUF1631 family protein n=1 Tax=Caldimonas sp. KR1-144 TaxID=3400911 RepID=UPI003C0CC61C